MKNILKKHGALWVQKSFLMAVFAGLLMFVAAMSATYWANAYTTSHASNSVTDIILDNIPTVNVDFVFSEGATLFAIIMVALLLYEPKRIPFTLKTIAIFTATRSAFLILTHIASPDHASYIDTTDFIHKISSGDDLFFSLHTGLPFLMALAFWNDKYLKYFFLVSTLIGAVSVLLGHLHYSIDVFSAPFIAFGVFHIARWFFSKDYEIFLAPLTTA
jgi:hypothetical protein